MKFEKKYIPAIIIFGITLLTILIFAFQKPAISPEEMEENPEIEEEVDEDIQIELEQIKTGKELYAKALVIFKMQPYCGKDYDSIQEKDIIKDNNIKYYKTKYSSIGQIELEIKKYFGTNPIGSITDYIKKNDVIYCKYNKPSNTKNFLGDYSLKIASSTEDTITYDVTTYHLGPNHSDACSIDKPINCLGKEKIEQNSKFTITKVHGEWKIKEFYNPYN